MRSALLLAGVGVVAAVAAGWWCAFRIGKVKRIECAAWWAAVPPASSVSSVSPARSASSASSALFSGALADIELSDAEIDALPPELPPTPVKGRGRPAVPSVKV